MYAGWVATKFAKASLAVVSTITIVNIESSTSTNENLRFLFVQFTAGRPIISRPSNSNVEFAREKIE